MEFDVEIREVKYHKVHLDDKEINDIVSKYINRRYNIYNDDWIKGSALMRETEHHGSHSWYEKDKVRDATDFDAFLLKLLKELK
jgi:hypothetical protein